MLKKIFIVIAFSIAFSGILISEEKDRIAVMDIQDKEKIFDEATRIKITDYIFTKMQSTNIYWMIPKADRDSALEQAIDDTAAGSRKECVDEKCQISLTAQLQANFLINPEVKKLYEGTCEISIKKFDVEKRAGVFAWTQNFNCSQQGLFETIGAMDFGGKKKSFQAGRTSEQGINMSLEAEDGTIVKFITTPEEAFVVVDGNILCPKTPCSKMVSFGKHAISIQKEKYVSHEKEYDIKQGDAINVTLEPNFGWITINSVPEGMEVELDGKDMGKTPIARFDIATGGHQLDIKNKCHYNESEKFEIKRGEEKVLTYNMKPREAAIKVTAKDEQDNDLEAEVFVDGNSVGKSPRTWKVPLCSGNVYVKADVGEFRQDLSLSEGEVKVIAAVLKKEVVAAPPP
ncbi:MAG TPA: PEGA domain-containing protein, partial [bacterium]|nr:PEGA domain-containing protein [bacterium]